MTKKEALAYLREYNSHSTPPPKDEKFFEAWAVANGRRPEDHRDHPNYQKTKRDRLSEVRSRRYDISAEMDKYPECEFQPLGPAGPNQQFPTLETAERLAALAMLEVEALEVVRTKPDDPETPKEYWFAWSGDRIKPVGPYAAQYNQDRDTYIRDMQNWNANAGAVNRAMRPVNPDIMFRVNLIIGRV